MPDQYLRLLPPEAARTRFARTKIQEHADREFLFLDLAVHAEDEETSALYELCADDAYQDATAIAREHDVAW